MMSKINKKSKIKTIYEAFTGELPVNEDWYQSRLKICSTCPFNTAVSGADSFLMKTLKVIDGNAPQCKACGCYIDKKAAMKEEECGLSAIGQKPLWPALKIATSGEEHIDIYNNSPEKVKLGLSKAADAYTLDYGKVDYNFDFRIEFLVETKKEISDYKCYVGCPCTKVSYLKLGNNLIQVNADFNRDSIPHNQDFSKNIYVEIKYNGTELSKQTYKVTLKANVVKIK